MNADNRPLAMASNVRGTTHEVRSPIIVHAWGKAPADTPAPPMSFDTQTVLERTLGLTPEQIAALGEKGVVGFLSDPVSA